MTVALYEPFTGTDHADFVAWSREMDEWQLEDAYEPPASKPKKEATGQDWSGRITAHIEKAKAEGRTLTAAQAAAELRKQDEEN